MEMDLLGLRAGAICLAGLHQEGLTDGCHLVDLTVSHRGHLKLYHRTQATCQLDLKFLLLQRICLQEGICFL